MGTHLTPIMVKEAVDLKRLGGRSLAVDGNGMLYEFLSLIRLRDGTPLKDSSGRVTSHLAGLVYRVTRLLADHEVDLVLVFDGEPPELKEKTLQKRRTARRKAIREYQEALERGDTATAFSKAVMTSRLSPAMVEDAKKTLELMGVPYVQAPGEAEAQAAHMARAGSVWAVASKDYDSLLFGAPRLVRFLTISGREYLPSRGAFRSLEPEVIEMSRIGNELRVTREQLVDLAILIGTDFNPGVRGIGPKTALELIRRHGRIEELPSQVRSRVDENFNEVRQIFLKPAVTSEYSVQYSKLRKKELIQFLCSERGFDRRRVERAVRRIERFFERPRQSSLERWAQS